MRNIFIGVLVLSGFAGLCKADDISATLTWGANPITIVAASGGISNGVPGQPYESPIAYSAIGFSGTITPSSSSLGGYAINQSLQTEGSELQVSANLSALLNTVGPAGPGFVTLTFTSSGNLIETASNLASWYGALSVFDPQAWNSLNPIRAWPAVTLYCSQTSPISGGSCTETITEPIMIGDSLEVTGDFTADATSFEYLSQPKEGAANGNFSVSYQVTDANGNPVEVIVAPEPATLALTLMGGAVAAFLRRQRAGFRRRLIVVR